MKIIKSIIFIILFLTSNLIFSMDNPNLNIPEDLTQEYEKFMEEFNNLPEEEKKMLEELANQIETTIKEEGLDPSNPDDLFKWLEKQESLDNLEKKDNRQTIKPVEKKNEPIITESSQDIDSLIKIVKELNKLLSIFRQKSAANEFMNKNISNLDLELSLFIYFLNLMENKEIIKYLLSKDFEQLKNNLESLYNTLLNNQEDIIIEESESANPYDILGLSLYSNSDEIDQAYNRLRDLYDPENIKNKLNKENYSEKEIGKKIKQAKLTFSFIQSAYDSLKDPREKNLIDKNLINKEKIEKKLEKISLEAFDKIKRSINNLLPDIINDIKKLFEKYKPEEIAKAKAYEEAEKKILAESKKKEITPSRINQEKSNQVKDQDELFWQNIKREQQIKQYSQAQYERSKEIEAEKTFQELFKKKEEKTPSKESEKPKNSSSNSAKKEEKKPTKKEDKKIDKKIEKKTSKKKPTKKEEEKESSEKLVEIKEIDRLLSNLKDSIKIEKLNTKLKDPLAPATDDNIEIQREEIEIKLTDILKNLEKDLQKAPLKPDAKNKSLIDSEKNTIKNIKEYFEQNKIKEIWELFKKLNSKIKKRIENKEEEKEVKELIKKYGKTIDDLYNKIYSILSTKLNRKINSEKSNFYGLSINENYIKDPEKDTKVNPKYKRNLKQLEDINLAKYRKYIKDIKDYFQDLSKKIKD